MAHRFQMCIQAEERFSVWMATCENCGLNFGWEDYIPSYWHLYTPSETCRLYNFLQFSVRQEKVKKAWDKENNLTNWLDTVTFDIFIFFRQCRGYFGHMHLCVAFYSFSIQVFCIFFLCILFPLTLYLTPGMYVVLSSMVWGLAVLWNWLFFFLRVAFSLDQVIYSNIYLSWKDIVRESLTKIMLNTYWLLKVTW